MTQSLQPQQGTQSEAKGGKPVIVDVFANGCATGGIEFSHEWRFEDGPSQGDGTIEVPKAKPSDPATSIHFHLHDRTGQSLRFDEDDPIWVKRSECPCESSEDPEIPRDGIDVHPKLLKITDRNSEECELHYNLRFKDRDGGLAEYDPSIRNGGR